MTIEVSRAVPVAERPTTGPAAGGGGGRRDRKKLATRQSLRNAALQLVAERGFANVTIEDITEAADVAPRTFFNYFPSKESAVIGADPERVALMQSGLIGRPAGESPLEALRAVLVEYTGAIAGELDDLEEGREAWFRRYCVVRDDPDLRAAYAAHVSELEGGIVDSLGEAPGQGSRPRSLSGPGDGDGLRRREGSGPVLGRKRRCGLARRARPARPSTPSPAVLSMKRRSWSPRLGPWPTRRRPRLPMTGRSPSIGKAGNTE